MLPATTLVVAVLFLSLSSTESWSLGKCSQHQRSTEWHNCVGTFTNNRKPYRGDKYVGEWKDGKFHGQGTFYSLADNQWKGDKYVGEWKDGKQTGQGTYYFLADSEWKGTKYVGEFRNGYFYGKGTVYYLGDNEYKGHKYIGEFRNNRAHGFGKFIYSDGVKYIGEVSTVKDRERDAWLIKFNGSGNLYAGDGTILKEGQWENEDAIKVWATYAQSPIEPESAEEPIQPEQVEGVVRKPSADASTSEIVFWQTIAESDNPDSFIAYLEQFPDGIFAVLAHIKLKELGVVLMAPKRSETKVDSDGDSEALRDRLDALKAIHDKGLITDDEYTQKRREIEGGS